MACTSNSALNDRKDCPLRNPKDWRCSCVGKVCSYVSDSACNGLRSAYEEGRALSDKLLEPFSFIEFEDYNGTLFVAIFNELRISVEDVTDFLVNRYGVERNPCVIVVTREQWENTFGDLIKLSED